jgi:hypothetical protein
MDDIRSIDTRYCGVWIQVEGEDYWLCAESGHDRLFDHLPTEEEILDFVDMVNKDLEELYQLEGE